MAMRGRGNQRSWLYSMKHRGGVELVEKQPGLKLIGHFVHRDMIDVPRNKAEGDAVRFIRLDQPALCPVQQSASHSLVRL